MQHANSLINAAEYMRWLSDCKVCLSTGAQLQHTTDTCHIDSTTV